MIRRLNNSDIISSVLPIIKITMTEEVYNNAVSGLIDIDEDRILFGYFIKSKLVGFSGYHFDGSTYWISWTAVCPEHQRKGICQKLIDKTIKELKKLNIKQVRVETYEHPCFFNAIKFYIKNGFKLCGFLGNYLFDGSTVLYFKKDI